MQATAILPEKQQAAVLQFPPESLDDLEATTPEEEFEAWEAERVVWEEYASGRGV